MLLNRIQQHMNSLLGPAGEWIDIGWPQVNVVKRLALLLNLGFLSILFLSHIVAAAMGLDVLFRIIATTITFQIVFFGPLSILIDQPKPRAVRRKVNRASFILALPLSLGLGWAYGGMEWSFLTVILVVIPMMVIHAIVDASLRR